MRAVVPVVIGPLIKVSVPVNTLSRIPVRVKVPEDASITAPVQVPPIHSTQALVSGMPPESLQVNLSPIYFFRHFPKALVKTQFKTVYYLGLPVC